MKTYKELTRDDLDLKIDLPAFNTTADVETYDMVIGQKRAIQSIELGLNMDSKCYNIFISGKTGTGKTGYIVRKIEEYAKKMATPLDWCYVYNFENPNNPVAISFKAGDAIKFKEDLNSLIKHMLKEVPVYFNSENYEHEKNNIVDHYQRLLSNLTKDLNIEAKKRGFSVRTTPTGEFIFVAISKETSKNLTDEQYDQLSEDEKSSIELRMNELRNISSDIFKQTEQLQKKLDTELKQLDDKISETIILSKIEKIKIDYNCDDKILKYLDAVKKDIKENISHFFENDDETNMDKALKTVFFKRYGVNVLVSNSETTGAPVIFADSAQLGQLFGNIEYENKMGNLVTDFSLIKPGYLHKSNGGYIIIKAMQLLTAPYSWELLKKCINLENISINSAKYSMDILPISTLNPEEIPLKTKIILLGSYDIYSLLLLRDPEFQKIFKIKAEFDNEIENDTTNTKNLTGLLKHYVEKNAYNHISREGVHKLFQFCSRLCEDRNYFSSSMSNMFKIVDIANYFSKKESSEIIEAKHIYDAIQEKDAMHELIKKKIHYMYKSNKYIVDLSGIKTGQINGLSVVNYGDTIIGQQHRITVSTFAGRAGIINIEREAELSGSIHSKGIMILAGFVGELIGRDIPISFNANIVFEQLYSGIEGDSASAAELLALLSSLSEVGIKQSLAITGSVNQRGEIQPIGGVNDKIEGFFDICSLKGLDGTYGVIIPDTNVSDLILKEEVLDAVSQGKFHIYSAKTIDDCIELLFDPAEIKKCRNTSKTPIAYLKEKILVTLKRYNTMLKESKTD